MTDPRQIPNLIKLLDDNSPDIQSDIITELMAFGPLLQTEIKKVPFILNTNQKDIIDYIFHSQKRIRLKQAWPNWFSIKDDGRRLERALTILSKFLDQTHSKQNLDDLLGYLTNSYRRKYAKADSKMLARFLFHDYGLKGDEDDYYNPQNSNLVYVIKQKKGIPISLATIYMLVGQRLGLEIEGCHFPGHFLARIHVEGKLAFVDCFSGGQIIMEKDIVEVREEVFEGIEEVLHEEADIESIVRRYLANLIRAFQVEDNSSDKELMVEMFKDLDMYITNRKMIDITPEDIIDEVMPQFISGQVVRHARYGYRGIIVDIDSSCQATDSWYYGNQTQPERDQPWFHVLVHGSDQVTYVAESNLFLDESEEAIDHPLVSYFFDESEDGHYTRNENDWPDMEF